MRRQSIAPTMMRAPLIEGLGNWSAVPGATAVFVGAECRLFTNVPAITPDNVPADFTDCTFAGYALFTPIVWGGPSNADSLGEVIYGQATFTGGAIVAPGETAQGYYLTDAGGVNVYAAELFDDPVAFAIAGDFLELDLYFQLPFIWPTNQ